MPGYEFIRATHAHGLELGANMRAPDVEEIRAGTLLDPTEAVLRSIQVSRDAWTFLADGRVCGIVGASAKTDISDIGYPWFLSSNELPKHWRVFARGSRIWLTEMQKEYRALSNYVDSRYTKSIQWLRWLGFTVHDPIKLVNGASFCLFEWRR